MIATKLANMFSQCKYDFEYSEFVLKAFWAGGELRPIHMQILCIRDRIEANESKIWTFISHRYAVECNFAMVDEKRE